LNRAVHLGWKANPRHDVGGVSSAAVPETGTGHWVVDPGPHPVDAGRAADANFETIERTLPLLQQDAQIILLSSTYVFSGNRARMPGDAPRAPLLDHGRRLVDLEDMGRAVAPS
jgi:hypothetical protein